MGKLGVGRILFTRDGRRIGNAIITAVAAHSELKEVFHIRTDFGNTAVMTGEEIETAFFVDNDLNSRPIWNLDLKGRLQEQIDKLLAIQIDAQVEE